jgi:RNA polymerase sigma-70 factor (ECF subfamily)
MVSAPLTTVANEDAWIRRAQRSDARAFEALYRLHVGKVYGLCLRMTGNVSEAEDCTQEAFIQAWNKMMKFRGDSAFSTWLHRIAVNTVLGRIRKSKREQDRVQAVNDVYTTRLDTGDSGELRDLAEAVDRLPERKPRRCWVSLQEQARHSCTGQGGSWRNSWKDRDSRHDQRI